MLGHEGGRDGCGGGGAWREMVVVEVEEERGGRRLRRVKEGGVGWGDFTELTLLERDLVAPHESVFQNTLNQDCTLDPNQTAAKFYTEI